MTQGTASVLDQVRRLDAMALNSGEVRRLARRLRSVDTPAEVRIAFAGNSVFESLADYAETHLACDGLHACSHHAPFGLVLQELLDPTSGLRRFDPNFLFLHFELAPLLHAPDTRQHRPDEVIATIEPVVRAALANTSAVILLTNFAGPDCYDLGLADSRAEHSEQEFFSELNLSTARLFRDEPRVQIVDLCRLTAFHGRGRSHDRRLYYVARIPWHDSFLPVLADEIARHVSVALGRVRKCLVVDLDNTLWGGVLGEDGPHGIRIGVGDPVAEAHLDLQHRLVALRKRGILLAACSKNNPEDVDEVFRVRRDDMPLRREDFVCMKIGWNLKDEGLREIAAELNIGTDSLVFLDDNPAEIELIRQLMPEVHCVLVPQDPAARPVCLDRVHGLDRAHLTAEDLAKSHQYRENAARTTARREFADIREYLHSLQTRLVLRSANPGSLARVHQLFGKTNQFNLTTRRYTMAELEAALRDPHCRLLTAKAHDRFGELGLIGAVLVRRHDDEASIDNFVLSCRAMGRGIETAMLEHLQDWCFALPGCRRLSGVYLPSQKNAPVREFYPEHGFTLVETCEDGSQRYAVERDRRAHTPCEWINVEVRNGGKAS